MPGQTWRDTGHKDLTWLAHRPETQNPPLSFCSRISRVLGEGGVKLTIKPFEFASFSEFCQIEEQHPVRSVGLLQKIHFPTHAPSVAGAVEIRGVTNPAESTLGRS